jgi:predicted nucleotidyltransferase
MGTPELPRAIDELVNALAGMRGCEAVVLGGSRAEGKNDPASDWDIGV